MRALHSTVRTNNRPFGRGVSDHAGTHVHATINALSAWISAVQPHESWYLAGWIEDSPIKFLVDPGAVISALSLKCYENLVAAGSINTPLTGLDLELEAANRSDMKIYGMCSFELIV